MLPPARTPEQRKHDVLDRLGRDVDAWVATADPRTGAPYMVPLSFLWDGSSLLVATPSQSATGRNLRLSGTARVGVGGTRDVVMIDGAVEALEAAELQAGTADAFAAKTDFEPRSESQHYLYFRVRPSRIQAWREVNELPGRDVMRDGRWLVAE
ncbi:pyridoxamine 5'-phosphate oxidase family protein [Actinomadura sp. KC06]|uniref:pyridoxamine 5'-phosphate oxidase family protein n=1 Tax=Actinomadura sp. KC06 TaxID=2530369 RepID=UPI001053F672|nr:pyridoxamine 5'-phosphate oxidase family protein [Actinomadura sp. KC06]TDD33577.1 pyridoxamine 5'-phosphate oxidase family protein [Actinomadura sp. KC06]